MSTLDLFFLSVALAMDCFTISIVSGVTIRQKTWRVILQMSFFFGLFQAFMPLIGWAVARRFAHHIEAYDHWLAFGLLAFLGIRMIKEALQPEENQDPTTLSYSHKHRRTGRGHNICLHRLPQSVTTRAAIGHDWGSIGCLGLHRHTAWHQIRAEHQPPPATGIGRRHHSLPHRHENTHQPFDRIMSSNRH